MLHTKAAGRAPSIVVDSPFFGTTPRKIDLVRGSLVSSLAICRVSISVVIDEVAALVYFQHGLELGVGDDFHGVRQRIAEMQLYAQVALLYQMEAGAIALVGGQVKTEEGVAVSVCESVRSPRPATSCRSRRTDSCSSWRRGRLRNSAGKVWRVSVARPRTLRGR